MKDVAPWKWAVLIGSGVTAVVVWVLVLGGKKDIPLADSIELIDIETGQIYQFSTKDQQLFVPAKNPESGNRTLFTVWEEVDGTWYLDRRYLNALQENQDVKIAIDWSNGAVTTNGEEVERVK